MYVASAVFPHHCWICSPISKYSCAQKLHLGASQLAVCVYLVLRIEHANGVRFSFIASHFCRRPLRAVEAEMPQIMFHMTNRTNVLLVTLDEGNPLMKSQAEYGPYMDVPRPVAAATNSGCKKSANFKVNNRQTRRLVFAPPRAQGSEVEGEGWGGPGKCVWQNDI